jgi:hypothetical protein
MEIANTHVEEIIWSYIDRYIAGNAAAAGLRAALVELGVGLRPLLDHLSIRTTAVAERAREFEALGFLYDDHLGVIERDSWWAKVYRKPGFPAIYLDQAFNDHRGADSPIPQWVEKFTDGQLHHLAIQVDILETAIERLEGRGIRFSGEISGDRESEFRQIYTIPEVVDGVDFTVLELVERRWGYTGFISPMPKSR